MPDDIGPHGGNLRSHRLKDAPATFFVTKNVEPRQPVLTAELRAVICASFGLAVTTRRIMLGAFVVMPDHWHALFALLGNWTLPRFMHSFMTHVGTEISRRPNVGAASALRSHVSWQPGYHDTRIRSSRQFGFITGYILNNPVRRGLTLKPEDWDANSLAYPAIVTTPWPWRFEQDE